MLSQADMNGEQIIKEINVSAVLINKLSIRSYYPNILMRYLGSGPSCPSCDVCPVRCNVCPVSICCPHWHLYLTSTHVHIVRITGTDTIMRRKLIPFIDITEIKAEGDVADAGFCGFGSQITSPNIIMMELRPDSAKEFLPICCSYCNLPTVLKIYCSEDPTEFVTAVKQRMVTMPRE